MCKILQCCFSAFSYLYSLEIGGGLTTGSKVRDFWQGWELLEILNGKFRNDYRSDYQRVQYKQCLTGVWRGLPNELRWSLHGDHVGITRTEMFLTCIKSPSGAGSSVSVLLFLSLPMKNVLVPEKYSSAPPQGQTQSWNPWALQATPKPLTGVSCSYGRHISGHAVGHTFPQCHRGSLSSISSFWKCSSMAQFLVLAFLCPASSSQHL